MFLSADKSHGIRRSQDRSLKERIYGCIENVFIDSGATNLVLKLYVLIEIISLTDIAKYRSIDPGVTIHNWLRGRDVVEFLGLWEVLHNPDFKRIDFDTFKENAGSNAFVFSIRDWTEKLDAIGLFTKSGRYGGGIYAHIDIAFESPSVLFRYSYDIPLFYYNIPIF